MNNAITINVCGKECVIELTSEQIDKIREGRFYDKSIPFSNKYFYAVYKNAEGLYVVMKQQFCSTSEEQILIIQNIPLFSTDVEAREYLYYLEGIDRYCFTPDWNDTTQPKYYLEYDFETCSIQIRTSYQYKSEGKHYFETASDASQFIEEVCPDSIKKFMFDIHQ